MEEEGKILIIEDDEDMVEVMRTILETKPYGVIVAYEGEEGLRKVREGNPDLVILDIMMPKVDGFAVCRRLKGDPDHANIPILIITAVAEATKMKFWPSDEETLPADDYVDKPIQPADLLSRVEKLIVQRRQERAERGVKRAQ